MKHLRFAFALLLAALLASPASAQTLTLDQFLKLSALPPGLPLEKMTAALFSSEWSYRGRIGQTEETYWTANATDYEYDAETEAATSWVSLRPMPGGAVDVLFKTGLARNFEPIRKELKHLKLPMTPVTWLDCKTGKYEGQHGERYTGPNYTTTLYTGKKAPFSYVIVLRRETPAAAPAQPVQVATPATGADAAPLLTGQTTTP